MKKFSPQEPHYISKEAGQSLFGQLDGSAGPARFDNRSKQLNPGAKDMAVRTLTDQEAEGLRRLVRHSIAEADRKGWVKV
jgi:hypothetical protein